MTFGAVAISPRLGEIRLAEVASQVGDVEEFEVLVLDEMGCAQRLMVRLTAKWAATSWQKALQCHVCSSPARVLRVLGGAALCGRCLPRPTEHHRHKNNTAWSTEGALADQIIRGALDTSLSRPTRSRQKRLARQLKRNTLSRASALMGQAEALLRAVDNLEDG